MNTIIPKEKPKKNFVKVSTLDGGTLVRWYDQYNNLNESPLQIHLSKLFLREKSSPLLQGGNNDFYRIRRAVQSQ